MPPADSADDSGFEDALSEAIDSIREGHPDAKLPGEAPALQTVVEALSASAPGSKLRTDAARLLGMLAEQFPGELAPVAPAVADTVSEESGRRHLLLVLGYVSKSHPDAVEVSIEPVVAALDDDHPAVVRNAIWVLSNLAEEDREITTDVLPELLELVAHDDDEVRRRAASALGSVPEPVLAETPAVLERVLEQLESSSHYRTAGRNSSRSHWPTGIGRSTRCSTSSRTAGLRPANTRPGRSPRCPTSTRSWSGPGGRRSSSSSARTTTTRSRTARPPPSPRSSGTIPWRNR